MEAEARRRVEADLVEVDRLLGLAPPHLVDGARPEQPEEEHGATAWPRMAPLHLGAGDADLRRRGLDDHPQVSQGVGAPHEELAALWIKMPGKLMSLGAYRIIESCSPFGRRRV